MPKLLGKRTFRRKFASAHTVDEALNPLGVARKRLNL
jgi:hypothetical protein